MFIRLMRKILLLLALCLPICLSALTSQTKVFQLLAAADGHYTDAAKELATASYTESLLVDEEGMKLIGCRLDGATRTFLYIIDEKTGRCYKLHGFRTCELHSLLDDMVDYSYFHKRQDALESIMCNLQFATILHCENIVDSILTQYSQMYGTLQERQNEYCTDVGGWFQRHMNALEDLLSHSDGDSVALCAPANYVKGCDVDCSNVMYFLYICSEMAWTEDFFSNPTHNPTLGRQNIQALTKWYDEYKDDITCDIVNKIYNSLKHPPSTFEEIIATEELDFRIKPHKQTEQEH